MFVPRLSPPAIVALLFLCFGGFWILGTDYLLELYAGSNHHVLVTISKVKGSAFVMAAALLLYYVALAFHKRYQHSLGHANSIAQRYQGLYHTISDGVIEYDYASDSCHINAYLQEQMQYPADVLTDASQYHLNAIHPRDKERVIRTMDKYFNKPGEPWEITYRYRWPDGSYHSVISRGMNIANPDTGITGKSMIILHDVTASSTFKTELVSREVQVRKEKNLMIMKAQEEERKRLAMELHDNIGQLVSVARLYSEHQVHTTQDPVARKMHLILSEASEAIRTLSADMKPPEFSNVNLRQAIHALAERVCKVKDLSITIDCSPRFEYNISQDHKLVIYRIIQEQLNNILKYAEAKNVGVVLHQEDGEATICITDDGVGFNPEEKATGIGLSNMRSRLKLFDGDLVLESGKGKGCRLTATFSLT